VVQAEMTIPGERRVLDQVAMRSRVLEIGCGTGGLARRIARRGANVTAVDASSDVIAQARSLTASHLGIEYRVAEVERLAPRGFDIVIVHGLPAADVLARLAEALRPGACLLVVGRHRSWWSSAPELKPLAEIVRVARGLLPGCQVRRHFGGRHSLRFVKPRC
jgi:2-polyprenyl-3-methyl-5-hydroxy-6-metoxy-1,4-benzoquinol methylase